MASWWHLMLVFSRLGLPGACAPAGLVTSPESQWGLNDCQPEVTERNAVCLLYVYQRSRISARFQAEAQGSKDKSEFCQIKLL